jgi:cell division septation protein DedD
MHFGGDDSSGKPLSLIRLLVAVFCIAVPLVFGPACSKEEQKEVQTPRVVVPITNPVREMPQVVLASESTTNELEETPTAVTETGSLEDEAKQPDSPSLIEKTEEQAVIKEEDGYYKVQKGDSLFKIAGRELVYGNTLMWPSLFRLNLDRLGGMKVAEAFDLKWSSLFRLNTDRSNGLNVLENFEAEELPEGLNLKFVTEKDAKENLAKVAQKTWVVSVISSQHMKSLVPPAITLMKNGYRAYISEARVKGQDWMRLRVGFFATYQEATEEGMKIMSMLGEDETWVTRIAQSELENYGRY